jgi:succinate dehydrogenase/fumarate reductase-like Fe-S protein
MTELTPEQIDANERAADRAIAKHEAAHPGCNERYWYQRANRAEAAAAHFFHCRQCANDSELCPEGHAFATALGLVT